MNLSDLAKNFSTEESAISFLESQLWPDGPVCPHCGEIGNAFRMESRPDSKNKMRPGLWKCSGCRKTFRVTVGTIFEDSHIPLHKWMMAIHLMCASKKGMSAHQLHRMLGVTYKSAWFMAHRIRYAMSREHTDKLSGTVEVDETFVGGKRRGVQGAKLDKAAVLSLVERNGNVRSFHRQMITGKTLKQFVKEHVEPSSHIMTDDGRGFGGLRKHFKRHSKIRHSWRVYSVREGDLIISTNTIEGYFSILKRGINGVYHHVGKQHLHRYLSEFDFRYNSRDVTDGERASEALKGFAGKRLTYRTRAYSQN